MDRDDFLLLSGLLVAVCMICAVFGGIYFRIRRLPPTFEWAWETMGANTQDAMAQATAEAASWTATWTASATFTVRPSETPVIVTPDTTLTLVPLSSLTAAPGLPPVPDLDRTATLDLLFSTNCTCDSLPEGDERELDCEDFGYRWEMQACYEHCGGPIVDPYRLVDNQDGIPCAGDYGYWDD